MAVKVNKLSNSAMKQICGYQFHKECRSTVGDEASVYFNVTAVYV